MLTIIIPLWITVAPVASQVVCAIDGIRSRGCESNCARYCERHANCDLEQSFEAAGCSSCVCRTCPGGFCGNLRTKLDRAVTIAQKAVEDKITLVRHNLNDMVPANDIDMIDLAETYLPPVECKASSTWSDQFGCENAFEDNGKSWATARQGVGSWIYYKFGNEVTIHRMRFKNRVCPDHLVCGDTKKMRLTFIGSEGSQTLEKEFANQSEENKFFLNGIKATAVLMWVIDTYTSNDNGAEYIRFFNHPEPTFLMPSACTASSALNDHACENAYKHSDLQWATQGQGVGSWIEYDFGQNVLIRKIEFQNRDCECGETSGATLIFDDGSTHPFHVESEHHMNRQWIGPVVTSSVRFRVDSVYWPGDNGAQVLRFYGYGKAPYKLFHGEGYVPHDEGNHIGHVPFTSVEDCFAWCDGRSDCNSFARCDDNKHCWFKSKQLNGFESPRHIGRCTTYRKANFRSTVELFDVNHVDDGWNKYFGDRNNEIRKPFMLNVLFNMKRYLADVGYDDTHQLHFVANPLGNLKARMNCPPRTLCFGVEERAWPTKIGFNVNTNNEDLLWDTSDNKIASLILHEMSHSTAIASRRNLEVAGDLDLDLNRVHPHENALYQATRDWTYMPSEVEEYAKCYATGQECPDGGEHNNRPWVNMNWDVPLNSAASYEYWLIEPEDDNIVQAVVEECVSGDMIVESQSDGMVRTDELAKGMKIRGKDIHGSSKWCTVQDVYFNGMGTLFGNFTEKHLLLDDHSGMVIPSGNSGHEHFGARYTLFTDCPVMENKDGQLFTPLAQTFCGSRDFSWDEYIVLWNAIQQIVSDTGMFWFHLDETFTSCKNTTLCGNLTNWRDALPQVCESMMSCASSQDDVVCDDFEDVAQTFFERYIRAERVEEIKNAYGQYGSISLSVKESSQNKHKTWMLAGVVACGVLAMTMIFVVAWQCCKGKQIEDKDEITVV